MLYLCEKKPHDLDIEMIKIFNYNLLKILKLCLIICLLCFNCFYSYSQNDVSNETKQDIMLNDTIKSTHLAIKTNLIYDLALLPNLTAEIYLGKKWSIAVEGNLSRWTFSSPLQNMWYHRIQATGVELRKWFNSPYPLHGHALGVYTMVGDYDIRFFPNNENSLGYLSYLSWSTGLSYSYSFPISRRFNLEIGLAAGYLGGKYYKYNYCMEEKQWEKQDGLNRNYFGPTRVNLSLVWLLGAGNKTNYKK